MPDPEISIVIVSWNVRDLLIGCLRTIEQFVLTPHEIIVVDNNSADGTIETVRHQFPALTVIANRENFGFARANNQGWQKARSRYICFLNPDTEQWSDPFPAILAYFRAHPDVGCIGPELLNPNRTHQLSVRRFPSLFDQALVLLKIPGLLAWLHLTSVYRFIPPLARYFTDVGASLTTPRPVDQVMGAALCVPRAILESGTIFNEGYWIWFEEVDLCQRLHRQGLKVVYLPTAQIVHYGGQSFTQHLSLAKQVWFMKSLGRYAATYWSWPSRSVLYLLMPVSYGLTLLQSFFKPK